MKAWLAFAWRNLWRNGRRTWLTSSGIAFAVFLLVLSLSFQDGTFSVMVDNATRLLSGHVQFQHPDFKLDQKIDLTIENPQNLIQRIKEHPQVIEASARTQTYALVSVGERSFGAQVVGVQSQSELRWSGLPQLIRQGRYLQGRGEAVLGEGLARNLGLSQGDELVVLGTAKGGGVAAIVLTVSGIFSSGQSFIDRGLVQIDIVDFREAWGMQDEAHTISVVMEDVNQGSALAAEFTVPGKVLGESWLDLAPELSQTIEMKRIGAGFFFGIVAMIVTFSVVNSFMMTVFERTPEFGMLKAIGMQPSQVLLGLQAEALWLSAFGCLLGIGISALIIFWLAYTGVPIPGDATEMLAQFNIPDRIYPQFSTSAAWFSVLVMMVSTQIAALISTWQITRLRAVDALRTQT